MVERLFFAVPWGCLRFVIVVFPDHTHLQFLNKSSRLLSESQLINTAKDLYVCSCLYTCKEFMK